MQTDHAQKDTRHVTEMSREKGERLNEQKDFQSRFSMRKVTTPQHDTFASLKYYKCSFDPYIQKY